MRNGIIVFLVCVLVGLIGYGGQYLMRPPTPEFVNPRIGEKVDNFEFKTMAGATYELHDFTGRPVIVHFWATWCAPCVAEFPELVAYAKAHSDVMVLAVSSDTGTDKIERFLKKYAPSIPDNMVMVHDSDQTITRERFGTFQLPETYILSTDMVLKEKIIGAYANWTSFQFLP